MTLAPPLPAIVPDEHDELVPALRGLFSAAPSAMKSGPETLAKMLLVFGFLPYRPHVFAVEAAVEALLLDGEVAA